MRDVSSEGDRSRAHAFRSASKPPQPVAGSPSPAAPPWQRAGLLLAAAVLVQASFAPFMAFRGASPPLVVLIVGWYGLRAGTLRGLTFGLIAGACEDALAGTTGAAWTFATALAGLGAGRFARSWAADMPPALCAGAALVTVARYAVFAILMQVQGHPLALPVVHAHAALLQGVEAALIAAALLHFFPDLARTASRPPSGHAYRR